ncbi:UNVERIFIED_CONTAM: hypothetical protein KB579_03295 [Streptococcus canis]|uniref:Uncharacterized protein n=1 Tax=Streptococcus canis TaxID=1329 RepID=A0AAE4TPE3_STRCB|nr:hypothetical protein [Streptococcus canis]MDV5976830.1 hypothetical protein [Streptococcus canis]QKG74510.1 hypothetical protein GE023_009635 [Streptococcus canis]QKG75379.1 hypothetical protein GE022_003595 [Streptococcus canis]GFE45355.1 hypothetical protein ScFU6_11240 [Streptococcus canis]GMX39416.1 hypothetical protein ScKU71_06390 [Streptococcus canis]
MILTLEETLISYLFDLTDDAKLIPNETNMALSRQGLMLVLQEDLSSLGGIDDLYEATETTLKMISQWNDSEYEDVKALLIREGEWPADWLAKKGVSPT